MATSEPILIRHGSSPSGNSSPTRFMNQSIEHKVSKLVSKLQEHGIQTSENALIIRSIDEYLLIERYRATNLRRLQTQAEMTLQNMNNTVFTQDLSRSMGEMRLPSYDK